MLSRGDSGDTTVDKRLLPPQSKRSEHSAGEMHLTVRIQDAWRREHPGAGDPGPEDGWNGHLAGVVQFVEHDIRLRAQLAHNHRHRLDLIGQVEDLPFRLHHQVIRLALARPDELLRATSSRFYVDEDEPDRAGIIAELEATLRVLKLLTLLGLAAGLRYPVAALLLLHWVLHTSPVVPWSTPFADKWLPPRVSAPPGQRVLAEPRVARAPGGLLPLLSIAVRVAAGRVRPGGAL